MKNKDQHFAWKEHRPQWQPATSSFPESVSCNNVVFVISVIPSIWFPSVWGSWLFMLVSAAHNWLWARFLVDSELFEFCLLAPSILGCWLLSWVLLFPSDWFLLFWAVGYFRLVSFPFGLVPHSSFAAWVAFVGLWGREGMRPSLSRFPSRSYFSRSSFYTGIILMGFRY